jgi:uncharacterized protein (DUF2062 family)
MEKLRNFCLEQLKKGITPKKVALTIALGVFIGLIPMLGTTTILCTIAALALRLNMPAIHVVNSVVYPLQLTMLIPFYRAGAWLFRSDASSLSPGTVQDLIRAGILRAVASLWVVTMHALVAWMIVGTITGLIVYAAVLPLTRRLPDNSPKF